MTRAEIEQLVRAKARACGLDERIVYAQIGLESSFNPRIVGPMTKYGKAKGLAQFIDATARQYGITDPFDPNQAMDGYCRYMNHLVSKFNGDYRLALAGYHSGEAVAAKALNNCKGNPNTCNYVETILRNAGQVGAATNRNQNQNQTLLSENNMVIGLIFLAVLAVIATR